MAGPSARRPSVLPASWVFSQVRRNAPRLRGCGGMTAGAHKGSSYRLHRWHAPGMLLEAASGGALPAREASGKHIAVGYDRAVGDGAVQPLNEPTIEVTEDQDDGPVSFDVWSNRSGPSST